MHKISRLWHTKQKIKLKERERAYERENSNYQLSQNRGKT